MKSELSKSDVRISFIESRYNASTASSDFLDIQNRNRNSGSRYNAYENDDESEQVYQIDYQPDQEGTFEASQDGDQRRSQQRAQDADAASRYTDGGSWSLRNVWHLGGFTIALFSQNIAEVSLSLTYYFHSLRLA